GRRRGQGLESALTSGRTHAAGKRELRPRDHAIRLQGRRLRWHPSERNSQLRLREFPRKYCCLESCPEMWRPSSPRRRSLSFRTCLTSTPDTSLELIRSFRLGICRADGEAYESTK